MCAPAFKPDGNEIALNNRQEYRAIARILIELFASALALFFECSERWIKRCRKLDHDRRSNIGHYAQRDQAHPLQRAARKHIEEIKDAAFSGLKLRLKRNRIDPGERHMAQQAKDN